MYINDFFYLLIFLSIANVTTDQCSLKTGVGYERL